jgi:hypothetical protein
MSAQNESRYTMDRDALNPARQWHLQCAEESIDKWKKALDTSGDWPGFVITTNLVLGLAICPERRAQILAAQENAPDFPPCLRGNPPDNETTLLLEIDLCHYEERLQEFANAGLAVTQEALDASVTTIQATTQ